jgi:hypothetical protein
MRDTGAEQQDRAEENRAKLLIALQQNHFSSKKMGARPGSAQIY